MFYIQVPIFTCLWCLSLSTKNRKGPPREAGTSLTLGNHQCREPWEPWRHHREHSFPSAWGLGISLGLSQLSNIYSLQSQKEGSYCYRISPQDYHLSVPNFQSNIFRFFPGICFLAFASTPCHQKATLLIILFMTVAISPACWISCLWFFCLVS